MERNGLIDGVYGQFRCDLCELWTLPASPDIQDLQHSNLHSGHFLKGSRRNTSRQDSLANI